MTDEIPPHGLILGFPIRPTPLEGLPGAELAAPLREELGITGPVWKLRCPACGVWGEIDDDQLHGRVSVDHTDYVRHRSEDPPEGFRCTFHETHDFHSMLFGGPDA